MFKPILSTCTGNHKHPGCGAENVLITTNSRRLCQRCESKRKSANGIKKVSQKRKERIARGDGESLLFEVIWKTRPHICISCDKWLGNEAQAIYFSHTIPKKKREDLRLHDKNVDLECARCHHIWENGTLEQKMALKSFQHKMDKIKIMDREHWQGIMNKINTFTK